MSLEQSMTTLAEANLVLAKAMTQYATVMQAHLSANGVAVPAAAAAATNDEPAAAADKPKGTRRTKAQIDADAAAEVAALAAKNAASEPDPFADEQEEVEEAALTADDIRKLVLKVKEKNPEHALGILKKIGVSTLAKIEEKDYPEVVRLAGKCGVTL